MANGVILEHVVRIANLGRKNSCDHCERPWNKGDHEFSLAIPGDLRLNAYLRIELCEKCAESLAKKLLEFTAALKGGK